MPDDLSQVQQYRAVVLRYEALDEQIDALIMRYGGSSEKMPPADFALYRQLAAERDEIFSQMRELEQELALGLDFIDPATLADDPPPADPAHPTTTIDGDSQS